MRTFRMPWLVSLGLVLSIGCSDKIPEAYKQLDWNQLTYEALRFHQAGDFHNSLKFFKYSTIKDPHNAVGFFNVACAQARLGNGNEAIKALEQAADLDLAYVKKTIGDADLSSIRDSPEVRKILSGSGGANSMSPVGKWSDGQGTPATASHCNGAKGDIHRTRTFNSDGTFYFEEADMHFSPCLQRGHYELVDRMLHLTGISGGCGITRPNPDYALTLVVLDKDWLCTARPDTECQCYKKTSGE